MHISWLFRRHWRCSWGSCFPSWLSQSRPSPHCSRTCRQYRTHFLPSPAAPRWRCTWNSYWRWSASQLSTLAHSYLGTYVRDDLLRLERIVWSMLQVGAYYLLSFASHVFVEVRKDGLVSLVHHIYQTILIYLNASHFSQISMSQESYKAMGIIKRRFHNKLILL